MAVVPDLEGFRDAQAKLRADFGEDIPFFVPSATTWPIGTPIDPESNVPYDPTILPTASGFASASVRSSVVFRPLGLSRRGVADDVKQTEVGRFEAGELALIVGYDDFVANGLDEATEAIVHDERYVINTFDYDRLGEDPDGYHRVIIYLDQK